MGLRPERLRAAPQQMHTMRSAAGAAAPGAAPAWWAKHEAAAVKFPEYLSGDQAQKYFADSNNEYEAEPGQPGDSRRELVPNSEARPNSGGGRHIPAPAGDRQGRPENIVLILPDSD